MHLLCLHGVVFVVFTFCCLKCQSPPPPPRTTHPCQSDTCIGDPNAEPAGPAPTTMHPEPTPPPPPPPPVVRVESSAYAPSWWCSNCGHLNLPVATGWFCLSRFCCASCSTKGIHDFDFCLSNLKLNGNQVVPPAVDQGNLTTCSIHASLTAMEIRLRQRAASVHQVFGERLSWVDVLWKYENKIKCALNGPAQGDKCEGRLSSILDIVRDLGVVDEARSQLYKITSWKWCRYDELTFDQACALMAEGQPLVTVVTYMPHMVQLKENDVYCYSTKGYPPSNLQQFHVVVLIGGRRASGKEIFWFIDSHGQQSQVNGVGKLFREECKFGFGILEV